MAKEKPRPVLQGVLDPEYVDRVSTKVGVLDRKSHAIRESIKRVDRELARGDASLQMEMTAIKSEFVELDEVIHATMKRVENTIKQFRNVSMNSDLMRLRAKADAWAPERRITREEFVEMLEEL